MKTRTRATLLSFDVLILLLSFAAAVWLKQAAARHYFLEYAPALGIFVILWLGITHYSRKFDSKRYLRLGRMNKRIITVNLFILGVASILMYGFRELEFSRFIVFFTIFAATGMELVIAYLHFYLKHAKETQHKVENYKRQRPLLFRPQQSEQQEPVTLDERSVQQGHPIDRELINQAGREVYHFIQSHINLSRGDHIIYQTTTAFNIKRLPEAYYSNLVNLRRLNDIRYVNKFLEAVNSRLPAGGTFIGCVETKEQRKQRILRKYPRVLNIGFYILDFIVKRIFPKFNLTKRIYFFLTRGNNRVISKAETLGRLYACGFELAEAREISGYYYFTVQKVKQPAYDENPTYGPFVKLSRIGKNGKRIQVYKLRTMHPFSEYIQDYVYRQHHLQNGGKFDHDFRVTTLGRIFRKFWIDEIPMIVNLIRGEIKLIGVRPLSDQYFNLYDDELQKKRTLHKPGLIPPFYADMPETLDEIQESEMRYLQRYEENPRQTDMRYFQMALHNIVMKKERSN